MSEIVEADRTVDAEIELVDAERRAAEADAERALQERRYVPGTDWRAKVPRVASWVLYFVSAYSLVSALLPWVRRRDDAIRTVIEVVAVPAIPSIAWAALLAIVASGLARRKRVAFRTLLIVETVQTLLLAGVVILFRPVLVAGVAGLAFSIVTLAVLIYSRREFYAVVQKGNGWRALFTFAVGAAITLGVGFLLTTVVPGTLPRESRLTFGLAEFFSAMGFGGPTFAGAPPRIINFIVGVLGAVTFLATAYVLFRPQRKEVMLTGEEEVEVRALLREHGDRDSLGYFATRRDKSVIFSPSHKAAITYRVLNGVSLASADPLGDPEAWPAVIESWLEEARRFAWAPGVAGASKEGAEAFARAGLSALQLGDEAILNFHDFKMDGRAGKVVRQAVSRVERSGYTSTVRRRYLRGRDARGGGVRRHHQGHCG